ncbi:nuclear transport factor 2 family protein [Amycolatopsis echigonensis]|uniref:Ketosteroid isomerase-like protein n=1 Tax=Amycolatopsis echigonensis TaxID=2576905 RepID=A0A2N3WFM7_9PSEU|nr:MULTISPECIES: nuclear transport factor 2 family protein [Amycolatopsis]MBB2499545.1 nuclear transport factor 2 family protein [Amycolatopsis echigonensis]PKV92673.1 ketosteroid isomerase-like protein [Amycolatopsis niigatensis]
MPRTVSEVAEIVANALSAVDAAPLADVLAEDAVYEIPFTGHRSAGRDAVLATLGAGSAVAARIGLGKVEVTTTETADGFAVELVAEGRNPHTGHSYRLPSSAGLLTVRDGEITRYRDYPNNGAATALHGTKEVFQRFLDAAVDNRWDDLADLYSDDVVIEIPFAPAGVPKVTRDREELRKRFHEAGQRRRITKADRVVVHETSDPEVLVAEYDLHGEYEGKAYVSTYAMVLTVRDGRIVHSRDYSGPPVFAESA